MIPRSSWPFAGKSGEGSLVAISRETQAEGIEITDDQIRRLVLVLRAAAVPEFDLECYNRHL